VDYPHRGSTGRFRFSEAELLVDDKEGTQPSAY